MNTLRPVPSLAERLGSAVSASLLVLGALAAASAANAEAPPVMNTAQAYIPKPLEFLPGSQPINRKLLPPTF